MRSNTGTWTKICTVAYWSNWNAYVPAILQLHLFHKLTSPPQVNLNARANIMYFMEALCDMAAREEHTEFIRMMERDILKIIDLVAPDDGSGAANVKVVRKVLAGLQAKRYLNEQTVRELEECIKDRDQIGGSGAAGSPGVGTRPDARKDGTPMRASGNIRIDKRQVEQRIEEDRERHKRLREGIWAVGTTDEEEFEKAFEETGPWDDDDEALALEEANERASFAGYHAQAIDEDDE